MSQQRVWFFGLVIFLGACGNAAGDPPLRSPSLDYQAPAARTADGDVVGADKMSPSDKLNSGPTNATPAPGPAEKPPHK